MNARESAVARVIQEAAERIAGGTWSVFEPCRCWTEPARVHSGHCCMETEAMACHQDDGMAAFKAIEGK